MPTMLMALSAPVVQRCSVPVSRVLEMPCMLEMTPLGVRLDVMKSWTLGVMPARVMRPLVAMRVDTMTSKRMRMPRTKVRAYACPVPTSDSAQVSMEWARHRASPLTSLRARLLAA
jgi:hypothetical protein